MERMVKENNKEKKHQTAIVKGDKKCLTYLKKR